MNFRFLISREPSPIGMAALLALGALSCSSDPDVSKTTDRAEDETILYSASSPLEIELSVPEQDWDELRYQGRDVTVLGCGGDNTYKWYEADLVVNGEHLSNIEVRKKGYLASLSSRRPSLRVKLNSEGYEERTLHGAKELILNNDRQDPSHARQCLTYALFERAGLPAPRCALSKLVVNGTSLGTYTHVEALKKPFLRRVFGDDSGNLYEGQLADFVPGFEGLFEAETNEDTTDRSDLARLSSSLEAPDDRLEAELSSILDIEEFITFWAMEALTGHWDSYSGNRNNFYVYHDPSDDKLHFIVYGADNSFVEASLVQRPGQAVSVYTKAAVSARLYKHPKFRAEYEQRLRQLVDELWDEETLVAEAERWAALGDAPEAAVAPVVSFIRNQKAKVLAELDGEVGPTESLDFVCTDPVATSGSIEVSWVDALTPNLPPALIDQLELPFQGAPLEFMPQTTVGWAQIDPQDPSAVSINVVGLPVGAQAPLILGFTLPLADFVDGEHPFHAFETSGGVADLMLPTFARGQLKGVFGAGSLSVEGATRQAGSPVRVSWSGSYVPWAM